MRIFKNKLFLLVFIVAIAAVLRLYQLGQVPQSLNWDEVSLGYNAYSILTTGRDEYGDFLPVVLRSFDDYKPALYSYLVIPFVAIIGLTEQAVRLPSALAGISAVVIVYFLVQHLLSKNKIEIFGRQVSASTIALLTSFFLAISPWHIQFSRISFESNVGLTINLLAFLLFLKGLKKHYFLPISFAVAALNIHMYQSDRVFSPLLIIALCIIFYKQLLVIKKWVLLSVICAFVVALPLGIYILNNDDALMRARGVSVFSDQKLVERSAIKLIEDEKNDYALGKVLDNRRVDFFKATAMGYISHFDPNWLFITGDIARHHAPFMGLLYIFQIPFLLIGIYMLVYLPMERKYKIAFFTYFLLVPVPASITSGVPHAVRTLNFPWTWELFIAIGLITSILFIIKQKNKLIKFGLYGLSVVYLMLSLLNFSYYLNQYFVQLNYYHAEDWLYGYKQVISYVDGIKDGYDHIIVENEAPFDQSYMFFLFYLKVDPSYYQKTGGTASGGFRQEHRGFDRYKFKPVTNVREKGKVLLVGSPGELDGYKNKKVFYLPNGKPVITVVSK